jgi:hypothetical protein
VFYFVGWIKCETNVNEIVKIIWKIWCHEREHHPRAGIILLYYDELGSAEVSSFSRIICNYYILSKILLTKYKKKNSIQYGYAKGKIKFGENIWNFAAREVN